VRLTSEITRKETASYNITSRIKYYKHGTCKGCSTKWKVKQNTSRCVFRKYPEDVGLTQLPFYLKATCFGIAIDQHQLKKHTLIKRQVQMQYTKHYQFMGDPTVSQYFVFRKILKAYRSTVHILVNRQSILRNYSKIRIYNKELTQKIHQKNY
jgi:hypothetical protein